MMRHHLVPVTRLVLSAALCKHVCEMDEKPIAVIASDGQSYELDFIRKWFTINPTSPVTREALLPFVYGKPDGMYPLNIEIDSKPGISYRIHPELEGKPSMRLGIALGWVGEDLIDLHRYGTPGSMPICPPPEGMAKPLAQLQSDLGLSSDPVWIHLAWTRSGSVLDQLLQKKVI